MALSVTVNSVDLTSSLERDSLNIEQAADTFASTCSFALLDLSGTLSVSVKQSVVIADNGTTLFKGEVSGVGREAVIIGSSARRIVVEAQDYNILLEETVVELESYGALEYSDDEIIADLFATYRSDIGVSTYVDTLDPAVEELNLEAVTLRQALSDLCALTGGLFYVDFDKELHYFSSGESNTAAFYLSDSPSGTNPKGYESIVERVDGSLLANRFYIVGNDVQDWEVDATSVAAYGEREAAIKDNELGTDDAVTDRGAALLAQYKDPRTSYVIITTNGAGLRAGMDLRVVCSVLGLDTTLTIRKMAISLREDEFLYTIEMGAVDSGAGGGSRSFEDRVRRAEDQSDRVAQEVFDTTAPDVPEFLAGNLATGVTVDADGHQIVYLRVTWGSVSADDLDHYEVNVSTASDFSGFIMSRNHPADGDRAEQFDGVLGNTTYYARVRAVDWSGNASPWSTTRNITTSADTTPPAQVTGLSAGSSRTLVGLQWTANTEADLMEYEIQRAPDVSGSPGTWATVARARLNYYIDEDFTDGQIAAQNTFWYRVRAIDTSTNAGDWATQTSATLGQINGDHIVAACITGNHIAANTITAANITAGTITATEIAASTITADRLNIGTLSAISADMGTLTAGEIRVGTGTPGVDFTGFRIYSTYIGGFDDDDFQVGIRASDGALVAADGDFAVDAAGVRIAAGEGSVGIPGNLGATGQLMFVDSSGNALGGCGAQKFGSTSYEVSTSLYAKNNITDADLSFVQLALGDGETFYTLGVFQADGGDPYVKSSVNLFVSETGNANMTLGITINQGANDDELLAGKSSDVAHGMTAKAETDTYFTIIKHSATAGGIRISGFRDADDSNDGAITLWGYLGEAASTTKSTSGWGIINMVSEVKSGTGSAAPGANANLLSIGSSTNVRFIFDQEGEMHSDDVIGEGSDWDEWNDLALAADLSRLPRARWHEMLRYQAQDFERAGLLTLSVDAQGRQHAFIRHKAMLQFAMCCFGEVQKRLQIADCRLQVAEEKLGRYERLLGERGWGSERIGN